MLSRQKQIGTIAYLGGVMALPEPFTWAWGNMLMYTKETLCGPDQHIHVDRTKLSLHAYARNELLSRMRGDWILMFDTDLSFEPDVACRLVRLLETKQIDVVCGIYSYKKPPHFPVVYMHNPATDKHEIMADWDRKLDLLPIDSAGAGVLLIRRSVCERITNELHESPFDMYPGKGEDHSFFIRLRKLGIQPYCAPHVEADHLEYYGVRTSVDYVPPPQFDSSFSRPAL